MIIMGIDPGLSDCGWGFVNHDMPKITHLEHGAIKTKSDNCIEDRLKKIYNEISEVIEKWKPEYVAIESLFFTKNISSALPVAHARGVAILACAMHKVKVYSYTPPEIKMSVIGSGRGEKSQVQDMVRLILKLSDIPKPDHAADALAAAICFCQRCNNNEKNSPFEKL